MHIEPGFIIEVTSWENDGDNYSTRRLSGQSKHVAYVADQLLPLFNSKSAGGLGNFYQGVPDRYYQELYDEYISAPDRWKKAFKLKEDECIDLATFRNSAALSEAEDMLRDLGVLFGGNFTTRVVSGYNISYTDTPIKTTSGDFYTDDDDE